MNETSISNNLPTEICSIVKKMVCNNYPWLEHCKA